MAHDKGGQAVDDIVPKVLDIAHRLGVDAGDIDSSHVSAYPEYEWRKNKKRYLGETVVRNIHITLRVLDSYGSLLAQLSKLPLARIHGPSLSHSNLAELRLAALKDALAKGQRKALVIAQELAVKLGHVLARSAGHSFDPVHASVAVCWGVYVQPRRR